ncbi:MAG TPA: FAD-dependent oxidoreductase [Ktedonosporobacter sp.]|nr:FAD-dependent oxidoreductase [Ktedonosporobacter sp.]
MANLKLRVAVLGGGIRGTAIAALLAQSNTCKVMLFERNRIASGTSSTNHGRIHCGAGLWRKNINAMAHRHQAGGRLISQLSTDFGQQEAALYLIESLNDVQEFEVACQRYAIPHKQINVQSPLIQIDQFAAAYEIPEYAFSPAHLAASLAGYAEDAGASIHTRSEVQTIEPGMKRPFKIRLANGVNIEVDVIINALGSWANQIRSEMPLPRINLSLHSWRILCLYTPTALKGNTLNRVITIIEPKDIVPSMIPHTSWMVFGCRLEPDILTKPDDEYTERWRPFHRNDKMDRTLLEVHAKYFLPLQFLDSQDLMKRLYSFSGVYPTFAGVYPNYDEKQESTFQLLQSESVPNYYVVCGENATTSIIDAVDTVQAILEQVGPAHNLSPDYAFHLLKTLVTNFTQETYYDSSPMIWEEEYEISKESEAA